jgi:hypothetical protein
MQQISVSDTECRFSCQRRFQDMNISMSVQSVDNTVSWLHQAASG